VKVFLTGATGFIGSQVARQFVRAGHAVHALMLPADNLSRIADLTSQLHLHEGNLLDANWQPPAESFDVALHLAWHVEPGTYLESPQNEAYRDASLALVKRLACPRWLVAGTSFEYAPSASPLREDSPTGPRTQYARCKLQLFQALQQLDVELVWPRLFYLYGPGEDARRFVPTVINALLDGRTAPLTTGDEVRDYLHVEDVARAVCTVATSHLTNVVNVGSGQPVSVREVATQIAGVIGRPELLGFGAYQAPATDAPYVVADTTKINAIWRPQVTLADGLAGTVEWWRRVRAQMSAH
jgi:nucleoside-diphosphate-sugar epimerase